MKKSCIIVCFLVVFSSNAIFSQINNSIIGKTFSIGETPYSIQFANKSVVFENYESDEKDILACTYEVKDSLFFVTLEQIPKHIKYFDIQKAFTKWLVIYSDDGLLAIYDKEYSKPLTGGVIGPNKGYDFGIGQAFYPSSELQEGKVQYKSSNIEEAIVGKPWAVSNGRNGIGEYLKIVAYENDNDKKVLASGYKEVINDFWISIGFVSFEKPYLYNANSRPSIIKVEFQDGELTVNLKDTPNFQHIILPKKSEWIKITIVDSYSGSKYQDCVISSLITRTFIQEK